MPELTWSMALSCRGASISRLRGIQQCLHLPSTGMRGRREHHKTYRSNVEKLSGTKPADWGHESGGQSGGREDGREERMRMRKKRKIFHG